MFKKARLKLTAWYLVIIMTISMLFSTVIYARVNSDLIRFERMQVRFQTDLREGRIREIPEPGQPHFTTRLDPVEIHEARTALLIILGIINLTILVISGAAGYFLAGITLKPIKQMMDEQKRFVSDSSHELRTPLTSLRSEIEVALRNKKLNTNEAKKVLESNLEEVLRLQKLSDNLLELAQNGKLINKNSMKEISIETILKSAIKNVQPFAKTKQIRIVNNAKNAKVNGIEDRLIEVFVILLDNAVKYSNKSAAIEILSKQKDGKVEISVIDYGIGISKKDLPHIFERFYRGDKSRNESGYGLGLSIAKKIVESHFGSITVKSEENKKTEFTVTLPKA
jgi:two-component system, OmpR family, sensor histidine kinase CiaH